MSLYTIVFIFVTILVIIGIGLFGLLVAKIDKWIDRKERLGRVSLYKKPEENSPGNKTSGTE